MSYSFEKKYDCVIVGAGAIGCSIAFFLAKESQGKYKVAIVDRNVVGDETSSGAAGMLAAQIESESAGPFFDLQVQSREIFKWLSGELEDTTGINIQYLPKGIAALAIDSAQEKILKDRMDWQTKAGHACEWLSPDTLAQKFPFIKKKSLGALVATQDGQVSSSALVQALSEAAKKLGVDIHESDGFDDLQLKHPKHDALETYLSRYVADKFVFAAGSWTGRLLNGAVPVDPVKGQILIYETPSGWAKSRNWQTPIYAGEVPNSPVPAACYLVPKGDNEIWVGATSEKRGLDKSENEAASNALAKYAAEVMPDLSSFKLKTVWIGLRPGTPDNLPVLGLLPGSENAYVASGHYRNGILLSAVTGKLMADLILKGKTTLNIDPFSPARFSKIPA